MNVVVSSIDYIINSSKAHSLWPLVFSTSCCGQELSQAAFGNYGNNRINFEDCKNSPKHADLLICAGVITAKMAPHLIKLYQQMPEPKYVAAIGVCAISGGAFCDSYNVIQGIDSIIPVDIYLPGCPPKPEALIDALIKLKNNIKDTSCSKNKTDINTSYLKTSDTLDNAEDLQIEYFGVKKL